MERQGRFDEPTNLSFKTRAQSEDMVKALKDRKEKLESILDKTKEWKAPNKELNRKQKQIFKNLKDIETIEEKISEEQQILEENKKNKHFFAFEEAQSKKRSLEEALAQAKNKYSQTLLETEIAKNGQEMQKLEKLINAERKLLNKIKTPVEKGDAGHVLNNIAQFKDLNSKTLKKLEK